MLHNAAEIACIADVGSYYPAAFVIFIALSSHPTVGDLMMLGSASRIPKGNSNNRCSFIKGLIMRREGPDILT